MKINSPHPVARSEDPRITDFGKNDAIPRCCGGTLHDENDGYISVMGSFLGEYSIKRSQCSRRISHRLEDSNNSTKGYPERHLSTLKSTVAFEDVQITSTGLPSVETPSGDHAWLVKRGRGKRLTSTYPSVGSTYGTDTEPMASVHKNVLSGTN